MHRRASGRPWSGQPGASDSQAEARRGVQLRVLKRDDLQHGPWLLYVVRDSRDVTRRTNILEEMSHKRAIPAGWLDDVHIHGVYRNADTATLATHTPITWIPQAHARTCSRRQPVSLGSVARLRANRYRWLIHARPSSRDVHSRDRSQVPPHGHRSRYRKRHSPH